MTFIWSFKSLSAIPQKQLLHVSFSIPSRTVYILSIEKSNEVCMSEFEYKWLSIGGLTRWKERANTLLTPFLLFLWVEITQWFIHLSYSPSITVLMKHKSLSLSFLSSFSFFLWASTARSLIDQRSVYPPTWFITYWQCIQQQGHVIFSCLLLWNKPNKEWHSRNNRMRDVPKIDWKLFIFPKGFITLSRNAFISLTVLSDKIDQLCVLSKFTQFNWDRQTWSITPGGKKR